MATIYNDENTAWQRAMQYIQDFGEITDTWENKDSWDYKNVRITVNGDVRARFIVRVRLTNDFEVSDEPLGVISVEDIDNEESYEEFFFTPDAEMLKRTEKVHRYKFHVEYDVIVDSVTEPWHEIKKGTKGFKDIVKYAKKNNGWFCDGYGNTAAIVHEHSTEVTAKDVRRATIIR